MNLQFFAEIYDEPRARLCPHDRLAAAENHLRGCLDVLIDEAQEADDLARLEKLLDDANRAIAAVYRAQEACDRADEYADERMCRHESV